MPYTVIRTEKALKSLKKLPRKTAARIVVAVEGIRDNPEEHLHHLRSSPYFKLRVGQYRVVPDLRKKMPIVYVIRVGKRENMVEQEKKRRFLAEMDRIEAEGDFVEPDCDLSDTSEYHDCQ